MNKLTKAVLGLFVIASIVACTNDDEKELKPMDTVLLALKNSGYTVENHELVINDKVINATELDLSNKEILGNSNFKILQQFPKLKTVVLDNNRISRVNDTLLNDITRKGVSTVSLKNCGVKSVNISGKVENIQILHLEDNRFNTFKGVTKDNLPAISDVSMSANEANKLRMDDSVEIDIISSEEHKVQRDRIIVPNEKFRNWLKGRYPEVFDEEGRIDITKEPKIVPPSGWFDKGNMDWTNHVGILGETFDAEGMGDLEGYQFFRDKGCIRTWKITYPDPELKGIDMSGCKSLKEFGIGRNYEPEFTPKKPSGFADHVTYLNITGCDSLKTLEVAGGISSIDLKGKRNLREISYGKNIKALDFSDCNVLNIVNNLQRDVHGALQKVILPKTPFEGDEEKNENGRYVKLNTLDLRKNTEVHDIDFSNLREEGFNGVLIDLSNCPNIKHIKLKNVHLNNQFTSFKNGYFKELELEGCKAWDGGKKEWVDVYTYIENWIKGNHNEQVLVNGKVYNPEEDFPSYVETFEIEANDKTAWDYVRFNENGKIELVGHAKYDIKLDKKNSSYTIDGKSYNYGNKEQARDIKLDQEWKKRDDWDFALHLSHLRTNSGASGNSNLGFHVWEGKKFGDKPFTIDDVKNLEFKTDYLEENFGRDKTEYKFILGFYGMPPAIALVPMANITTLNLADMVTGFYTRKPELIVVKTKNGGYGILRFYKLPCLEMYEEGDEIGYPKFEKLMIKYQYIAPSK